MSESPINSIQWPEIPGSVNILGKEVDLFTIIIAIVIVVAGFALARLVRLLTAKYIGAKMPPDVRKNLSRTVYYTIIAISLLSALGVSGMDLSGVFLAGGIAGIVIGFATQSLFSNLISGIFLHLDKPMKVGDPVLITGKLPEVGGVVVETTPLSTRFRMFDGTYVRLPNTEVFSSEIRNFSGAAARRVEVTIGIGYGEDIGMVIELINKTLEQMPLVLLEPSPNVYVTELGESSININVWCWTPFTEWFEIRMQIVKQLKELMSSNGIEIPFPQRVIHMPDYKQAPPGG